MRILRLARNFWSELTGVGFYTADLADWLHDRGHEVRVVTTPPYYPSWSVAPSERARFWRRDRRKPYPVLRCPHYVPRHATGKSRLAHISSFALSGLPAAMTEAVTFRPDIIGTVMPTIAAAAAALMAAALIGARTWLHVQDL